MEDIIIRLEKAAVDFGQFAIKPISMQLPEGYIIGIEGKNGAGKTTLIRMLLGRINRMQGQIYICGKEVRKEREEVLSHIGYISEENMFFEEYDAVENEGFYQGFYERWNGDKYRELLRRFQISAASKIGTLSRGNRIKFQLAFALAYQPKILIMDEPTAGLDPVFRTEFYRFLQEIVAKEEITVVFSSHLEEEINRLTDYVIHIEHGEVRLLKQ
ncbi:MAG: ABC transporter ATP-binding protein [Lachnospiraceae bacterium]|nr:ABC transporter ATP-binding protein [Lachnospiraceae bacterium]